MRLWRYGRVIERLGQRYRLEGTLGSGGMADVCLAWDERDEREVAIKVIKPDVLDQRSLDRFLKEAAQVAKWRHPNILRIYSDLRLELLDAVQGAIVPYIVMEYAQGGDLQKRLTNGQPYPLAATLAIFAQLCSAVAYAHDSGIIHRDLKPLNILFRELPDGGEQVVLSDFGLAVETDATHHTFARGGTLPYMAPEQLLKARVEPASDIFALGVILYQLTTGRLPFRRSLQDLRSPDAFALPRPPSSFEPSLPPEFDAAILTALAEEPADRYASAQQFWHSVQESIASLQISTHDHPHPRARASNAQNSAQTRILRDSSPYSTEPRQTSRSTHSDPNTLTGRSRRNDIASSSRSTLDSHPAAARHYQTRILPPESSPGVPSAFHASLDSADATPILSDPEIDTDTNAGGVTAGRITRGGNGTRTRFANPSPPIPSRTNNAQRGNNGHANGGNAGRSGILRRIAIPAAIVLILLVASGVYFIPALHDRLLPGSATATVLITPNSQTVSRTYTIAANDVSARQVTSSQAQSQTAQATGHKQVQATQARGQLTFINAAFIAKKVAAGAIVTGKDGLQLITDADANIPSANVNAGTTSSVSVPAHAANLGARGNVPALDVNRIYPSDNSIFVKNLNAFTGGQDAQNYTFVQQSDVDGVAGPLGKTLTRQGQEGLQARLNTGEQIAGAPQCTQNVTTDPKNPVGDTGVNVAATTVNVTVQCSAQAYNHDLLQSRVASQQGSTTHGSHYLPTGSSITRVTPQGTNLFVSATTLWVYAIDHQQQQALARNIAGLPVVVATRRLSSANGVHSAIIQGLAASDSLPADPTRISIVIK